MTTGSRFNPGSWRSQDFVTGTAWELKIQPQQCRQRKAVAVAVGRLAGQIGDGCFAIFHDLQRASIVQAAQRPLQEQDVVWIVLGQ